MIYAVYDRATKKVVKGGIAATTAACLLQLSDAVTQAVIVANTDDELAANKDALGVS